MTLWSHLSLRNAIGDLETGSKGTDVSHHVLLLNLMQLTFGQNEQLFCSAGCVCWT